MPTQRHHTETREWWNVEWCEGCTTCGYDSLELAREDAKTSSHPNVRIFRVTLTTHTTYEEAPNAD